MTGGQISFDLAKSESEEKQSLDTKKYNGKSLVYKANENELRDHKELCNKIDEESNGRCIWNISEF
jgi:hypothetical protein